MSISLRPALAGSFPESIERSIMNQLHALSPHSHWFLRLALGSVFLYHGLTKFSVLGGMVQMVECSSSWRVSSLPLEAWADCS